MSVFISTSTTPSITSENSSQRPFETEPTISPRIPRPSTPPLLDGTVTTTTTSLSQIPEAQAVDQAAQGVIAPPRAIIDPDPSLIPALNFLKNAISSLVNQRDDYGTILNHYFYERNEQETLQQMQKITDDEYIYLLTQNLLLTSSAPPKAVHVDILRLAALYGWFNLLEHLLLKMSEYKIPHQKDIHGWNLAHFIALHPDGKNQLQRMPSIAPLLDQENDLGATPKDFVHWLSVPEAASVDAFGSQTALTPDLVHRLLGIHHWTRPRFTPGALLRFPFENLTFESNPRYLGSLLGPVVNAYIDELSTQPNLLKIRKIQGPAVSPSLAPLKGEWECLTSHAVNSGDVLALYSGTVVHSLWGVKGEKISTKRVGVHENRLRLDPELGGGNLTQFINHGFPNCAFFRHLYHGVPIIAIIALVDMPANTPLYISYGPHYFTEMTPIIPNPEAIEAYLNDTNHLKDIPILECMSDGKGHIYRQKGKIRKKVLAEQVSLSDALKGWGHKIRLEYLHNSQDQLGTKISAANRTWLKSYCT